LKDKHIITSYKKVYIASIIEITDLKIAISLSCELKIASDYNCLRNFVHFRFSTSKKAGSFPKPG